MARADARPPRRRAGLYQIVARGQARINFAVAAPPSARISKTAPAPGGEMTLVTHTVSLANISSTERSTKIRSANFRSPLTKVSGALAFSTCNSKPLKFARTCGAAFPLLMPPLMLPADCKSISVSISNVLVSGSGCDLPLMSSETLRHVATGPRSLANCGAGICRSWPSREKLNKRGKVRQPFHPRPRAKPLTQPHRSEEHTSALQSLAYLVCRLLLEKR